MQVNTRLAREAILNRNGFNHLQIELVPPAKEQIGATQRKPVLIVFVLDRSGSMDGPARKFDTEYTHSPHSRHEHASKMSYAISSTVKFLSLLQPDDRFGVVSFDDVAMVEQPLTAITPDNINTVVQNIHRIRPRGTTNIADAIVTARKMIHLELTKSYNCKIVLLSDGQANQGISDVDGLSSLALQCFQAGITVSTLGIGLDYDSNILANMARSGGGLYYHVENLGELEKIFADELQITQTVTAKGVKLYLEIPDLVEIGENLNNYVQVVTGKEIEVLVGDLCSPRSVLFEIRNNFVDTEIVFQVRVKYQTMAGEQRQTSAKQHLAVVFTEEELNRAVKHNDVITTVMSLIKDNTIMHAAEAYERGDMDQVQATVTQAPMAFDEFVLSYDVDKQSVQEELDELPVFLRRTESARSTVKQAYARSSRAARGQDDKKRT